MKKALFSFLMAMFVAFGMSSCKTVKFGVDYKLNVSGDGDGKVSVYFPVGSFGMDGDAVLDLYVSNDTVKHVPFEVTTKQAVLASNKRKQVEALKYVNEFMTNEVNAAVDSTTAGGTYDFYIRGYVRERVTGLGFEVEKHITNRSNANAPLRSAGNADGDLYQFVK